MGYSSDDTIDYMLISEKPISRKQFQSTMKRSSRFIRESLEKFKRSTFMITGNFKNICNHIFFSIG